MSTATDHRPSESEALRATDRHGRNKNRIRRLDGLSNKAMALIGLGIVVAVAVIWLLATRLG